MKNTYITLALILTSINATSQNNPEILFTEKAVLSNQVKDILTSKAKYFDLDIGLLKEKVMQLTGTQTTTVMLPLPDGTIEEFRVRESVVMSKALAAKYPEIKTFRGTSINNASISVRFDISPNGFHAIMFTPKGQVFIDPVNRENIKEYQSYYKRDILQPKDESVIERESFKCGSLPVNQVDEGIEMKINNQSSGNKLRTYRLAVVATGEYTKFFGGTVAKGLAGVVTLINGVNSIYEKEVAIRFVLVKDNDKLIFTDKNTDGLSNYDVDKLIAEVQAKIDNIIGDANYDIGYGVSTGGNGKAAIRSVCQTGRKGTAASGRVRPFSNDFIGVIEHEIGHQFGAYHTFNGSVSHCGRNRTAQSAYEPGSGSTIMSYGGICSPQQINKGKEPYFHTKSFSQIVAFSTKGGGNTCAKKTPTGNNPPVVNAGKGGLTIPKSTPFELVGNATDPDGDALTYCWEQFDLGPAGAPEAPRGNAPVFRSFLPVKTPKRTFPQIKDIVNSTSTRGEILPNYKRSLTFRLTARDNKAGGGGVSYEKIQFDVTDQAGPFLVKVPNDATTLTALENTTIIWDVARTNIAPVNCKKVNILMSVDGGLTFPHTLVKNTENNGSAVVKIPNIISNKARIKIEAADNIFFDISNTNFNIKASNTPKTPIAPSNLTAKQTNQKVVLNWKDNSTNELEFVIERSSNNAIFSFLSKVKPNITTYTDVNNINPTLKYRVYAYNRAGKSYSNVASIEKNITSLSDNRISENIHLYPNPNSGMFTIKIDNNQLGKHELALLNMVGVVIEKSTIDNSQSNIEKSFDISNQAKGMYIIRITNTRGVVTFPIIKQ